MCPLHWRSTCFEKVEEKLPDFPIVLHGSSSVPQEYVKIIDENGGKLPDAIGIPEEQLRKAAKMDVCKINIDSDTRLAMTAAVRKVFTEKPGGVRPPQIPRPGSRRNGKLYKNKIINVLGSDGKSVNLNYMLINQIGTLTASYFLYSFLQTDKIQDIY